MSGAGSREQWIEAARQAVETGTADVTCPVNGDATLRVDWFPARAASGNGAGEYRLWCPACGAENYLLRRQSGTD